MPRATILIAIALFLAACTDSVVYAPDHSRYRGGVADWAASNGELLAEIHGAPFGPVTNTEVRYNTFVFANPAESDKAAILNCSACGPDILHAHHNILVSATKRVAWVGGSLDEHDNLYWNPASGTAPRIDGYTPTNPVFGDPLLVDPASGDFRLQDGSPALGYGAE